MHIIPAPRDYRSSTADECELYTSRLCPNGKQLTKLNKTRATGSENSHVTSPTPRKPKLALNLSVKGGGLRKEISRLTQFFLLCSAIICKQSGGSPVSSFPSPCFFLWPGSCSYHVWGTVLSRTSAGTNGQAPMTTLSHRLHGDCFGIWQCLPPSPSSSQTPPLPPWWLLFWLFLLIPSLMHLLPMAPTDVLSLDMAQ